jgi:hypothetical protein
MILLFCNLRQIACQRSAPVVPTVETLGPARVGMASYLQLMLAIIRLAKPAPPVGKN